MIRRKTVGSSLGQLSDPTLCLLSIALSTVLVPQAMAYAMLAPLPPVYGLYTSIVPVLIYCIFGTSRHMHTGTFAITTLLLGQAVRELMASQSNAGGNDNMMQSLWSTISSSPTPTFEFNPDEDLRFIGMILLLSFVVGVIQVVLSFIGAGQWASKHLLPDSLVGGFNTAAVFHIGTSQLKHFLGIKNVPASKGAFALIKTWIWLGTNMWTQSNWYTVALGILAIVMMTVMRSWEKARKTRHEQEQRRIEMKLVQERQALSEAITRVREEQCRQQELYQQQQQQQYHQGTHRPYEATNASSQAASNISLSTMANVPAFNTASRHTPSEAEQALTTALNESNVANKLDDLVVSPQQSIYIPIPDILFSVIILTVLTVIFSWDRPRSEGGFGIDVIGDIPKGLPQMAFPPNLIAPGGPKEWMTWEFVHDVILPMIRPALLIAFVVYVMSFSIAKQFGKKYGYKVDANQEMLTLGLASMGGSCFSGYACTYLFDRWCLIACKYLRTPCSTFASFFSPFSYSLGTGSLTRTAILSQSGGKTPLASLVGVVVVVLTLVWLTWCFERVPNAVLAAIVLVALQSLIAQIYEPFKLWKVEDRKVDAVIWVLTFLGVWVISVEIGIFIGIIAVVSVKLFMQIQKWMHPELAYAGNQRKRRLRRYSRDGSNRRRSVATPLLDDEDRARDSGDEYDDGESPLSPRQQRRLSTLSRNARRRTPSSSVLDPGSRASREAANWKQRLLQTKWGQQIGSWFGVERPFLADSIHTHTDEDDY